ncbi:NAD(P)H-binding protein [Cryptosporangium phraense]|uniref:SDR family NAD(P)-dependent oxidoreductase n=1 Tax=Cryptosporangium phraense TaxID=2593070 RepID=A0A545AKQ0_9ACTN|nr:NmrA family NAD(P)-binding protein [Cryptosporangium phraense]TQS41840.1 SDR family NAD(P)-dependent oxidoreductase [Cryptosporangium phraense]
MIVVTGATGALNGRTVDHLLERLPASEIGVSVRDVSKAQRFADRGVRVRPGSYSDQAALRHSFEGADQVLLVSTSDPTAHGPSLHQVGIDAAKEAGVQRILYTSHQAARAESPFFPAEHHFETEALLAESGVAWTSLRNGFYAHSLQWMLGPWQETGVIATPADGPVSWTAREDAAEAAAVILAGDERYDGPVTLTASAAPDFNDIAIERPVARRVLDDEEWVAGQVANGTPEPMARFMLGFYQAARAGHFAGTDPLLGKLLGREPRTVRDLLGGEQSERGHGAGQ